MAVRAPTQKKHYSNAADIDASKIPQEVINDLAHMLLELFSEEQKDSELQSA